MERTQDGDIVVQYEKAQESWFAHAPSLLAQMGDAVVEQHEGPGHASPAYHSGIEKGDYGICYRGISWWAAYPA